MAEALRSFPFVDDFSVLVSGRPWFVRLDALRRVLEPTIDLFISRGMNDRSAALKVLPALLYACAARARIAVALAYQHELQNLDVYNPVEVLAAMQIEWSAMVERDQISFTNCTDDVVKLLASVVGTAWEAGAVRGLSTAADLRREYQELVDDVRVKVIGNVLVTVSSTGKCLSELDELQSLSPVLPGHFYREMMLVGYGVDGAEQGRISCDLTNEAQQSWSRLLVSAGGAAVGYCYQQLFHPLDRGTVCIELGAYPDVELVVALWYQFYRDRVWTELPAVVELVSGGVYHVKRPGRLPEECRHFTGVIGGPEEKPDYFARALVDEFLAKHKRRDSACDATAPVDDRFGELTLVSGDGQYRGSGFADVSAMHYALVGEVVSPQLLSQPFGSAAGGDSLVDSRRGEQRLLELYERLDSGACIPEGYHERNRSRGLMGRRRPSLDLSGAGQVYHVFAAFAADDGGAGLGVWSKDTAWYVPGWTSYVADFKSSMKFALTFQSPVKAMDVRMDCTGEGELYLGQCSMPVENTVLWFTDSVRFELVSRSRVTLRISVPDSGSALAVGRVFRRYMNLPGYSVAVRRYSIRTNMEADVVRLKRERLTAAHAGCQIYSGKLALSAGSRRLRVTGLVSSQPVKLLVKTEPAEAFKYIGVCGLRLESGSRDYVSVLFDWKESDVTISLHSAAQVVFSVLQVVDTAVFDLTVRSRHIVET